MNKLICIIGPDAAGKTTQANWLIKELKKAGVIYEYRWVRFRHFLSLPILAIARLMGLSEMIAPKKGIKIGYHYFKRSKIISWIYSILFFIDTLILTMNRVYIPMKLLKKKIVCDRFTYDAIIDLMLSIENYNVHKSRIGKLFLSLIPEDSKIIILNTNEEILKKRRDDAKYDKTIGDKVKLYKKLAREFGIPMIDAGLPAKKIQKKISKEVYYDS